MPIVANALVGLGRTQQQVADWAAFVVGRSIITGGGTSECTGSRAQRALRIADGSVQGLAVLAETIRVIGETSSDATELASLLPSLESAARSYASHAGSPPDEMLQLLKRVCEIIDTIDFEPPPWFAGSAGSRQAETSS